jgi:hypothetical protein
MSSEMSSVLVMAQDKTLVPVLYSSGSQGYIYEAVFVDEKASYGARGFGSTFDGAVAALWVDYRIIRRMVGE